MEELESELELAWEEVSFWRDYVAWWATERSDSSEPRVQEALENAWERYERALHDSAPNSGRFGYTDSGGRFGLRADAQVTIADPGYSM